MKKLLIALPVLAALSACETATEDDPGSVIDFNGDTVTMRGFVPEGARYARPTVAMEAKAKEICPRAEYLSARPYGDGWTFAYLFKC